MWMTLMSWVKYHITVWVVAKETRQLTQHAISLQIVNACMFSSHQCSQYQCPPTVNLTLTLTTVSSGSSSTTSSPTFSPTAPTRQPMSNQTASPTNAPTGQPTSNQTSNQTASPTNTPTQYRSKKVGGMQKILLIFNFWCGSKTTWGNLVLQKPLYGTCSKKVWTLEPNYIRTGLHFTLVPPIVCHCQALFCRTLDKLAKPMKIAKQLTNRFNGNDTAGGNTLPSI